MFPVSGKSPGMPFSDEWLVPAVAALVPEARIAEIRAAVGTGTVSLWETILDRRIVAEEAVLNAVATRFRMPLADLNEIDRRVARAPLRSPAGRSG